VPGTMSLNGVAKGEEKHD